MIIIDIFKYLEEDGSSSKNIKKAFFWTSYLGTVELIPNETLNFLQS